MHILCSLLLLLLCPAFLAAPTQVKDIEKDLLLCDAALNVPTEPKDDLLLCDAALNVPTEPEDGLLLLCNVALSVPTEPKVVERGTKRKLDTKPTGLPRSTKQKTSQLATVASTSNLPNPVVQTNEDFFVETKTTGPSRSTKRKSLQLAMVASKKRKMDLCDQRGEDSTTLTTLDLPKRNQKSEDSRRIIPCRSPNCGTRYLCKGAESAHYKRVHAALWKCKECEAMFTTPERCQSHINTKHNNFAQMVFHRAREEGCKKAIDNVFTCRFCGTTFAYSSGPSRHIKNIHPKELAEEIHLRESKKFDAVSGSSSRR